MKHFILTPLKSVFAYIPENKGILLMTSLLSAWQFLLKQWQMDVVLFLGLGVLICANTITGVRRAKFEGKFDKSLLRTKTQNKCIGYAIWLISMYMLVIMVLTAISNNQSTTIFPIDWLHYPIVATYLFMAAVEANSTRTNIKATGVIVPNFDKDLISKVIGETEQAKTVD